MSLDRYGAAFVNFFARYSNNKQFVLKPAKYHLSLKRNAKSGRKTKSIETADCYQHKKKLKMRKIYNICLFVGVIALMLSACKKDNQNQIFQNTGEEVYWTAEDLRIQNNILSFQNKIKNNSFKSDETIELDSAKWYMEALLNYNYSTPDSSFAQLTIDTSFQMDIFIDNGGINFADLQNAVFSLEQYLIDFYNNINDDIKFVIATDINVEENESKSSTKTITMTTAYGASYVPNPNCFPPFGEDDYWDWGFDLGGCESNPATSSDAAEEIQNKINHPRCLQADETVAHYIAEIENILIFPHYYPNPNDDIPNDNWLDYLIYHEYDDIYPADYCLEPEEMNFYLEGALEIIQTELQIIQNQNPGENWIFLNIDLHGQMIEGGEEYGDTYFHEFTVSYGRKMIAVPPID
jgi:hypothetical protein